MDEVRASVKLFADPKFADLKAQKLSVNVNAPPGVQATVVSGVYVQAFRYLIVQLNQ